MQTFPRITVSLAGAVIAGLLFATSASAETSPKMKMTTPMPESITTPARIESRVGTLEFPQGYPTDNTAETLYEYLEFMHGVAFLYALPVNRPRAWQRHQERGRRQPDGFDLRATDGL